jgi:hypothetical protein
MNSTSPVADLPDDTSSKLDMIPNHPLAAIAGQFEGDFWEATLKAIKRQRNVDRKRQQVIEVQQDAG